jgi:hypothetical protein
MNVFSESSNTYALEDLTRVTPYLAPDLLQSTIGVGTGGSTSIQFRLPQQHSCQSVQQYVSTPLGPTRTMKPAVPIAKFDEESSFALSNSLGFQHHEKQFVDASTDPEPMSHIEQNDFSCQMAPIYVDQQSETISDIYQYQSTQTDRVALEDASCQINADVNDCTIQTDFHEQNDFSCQCIPVSIDQTTETKAIILDDRYIQTDLVETMHCASQITPNNIDQETATIEISMEDIAQQTSLNTVTNLVRFD